MRWIHLKITIEVLKNNSLHYFHLVNAESNFLTIFVELPHLETKKNIIFIGVHCRRTDYVAHYRDFSHGDLVDRQHFISSFEIFRFNSQHFFIKAKYQSRTFKIIDRWFLFYEGRDSMKETIKLYFWRSVTTSSG